MNYKITFLFLLILLNLSDSQVLDAKEKKSTVRDIFPPVEISGFLEGRAGVRTQNDPEQKNISVLEARLQAELYSYTDWIELKYKGDIWGDGITEKVEYETREAWFFARPLDFLDIKIGRQVLTWGTGDLVFLNDMFPKDYQSYFIGRDQEYLKAPSDAAKMSLFMDLISIDLVYTPKFNPDRYITGKYVSYWNEELQKSVGLENTVNPDKTDGWFQDEEIAIRFYRNINNYELAMYGYRGFWKQPGGETPSGRAIFPKLNVYGASVRGQVGAGIGNVELAFYQSGDDENGSNSLINNSEIRYLVGYTQDLAQDFNASLQYYIEQLLDYTDYQENCTGKSVRDRSRHVLTLQLTQLTMNQNLELSLAANYSPTDQDGYLRPNLHYKYTDNIMLEAGANIFCGKEAHTFFGQLQNNTNIYSAVRYSF